VAPLLLLLLLLLQCVCDIQGPGARITAHAELLQLPQHVV
jgi:hypothetical protein